MTLSYNASCHTSPLRYGRVWSLMNEDWDSGITPGSLTEREEAEVSYPIGPFG